MKKNALLITGLVMAVLLLISVLGAVDAARRGAGFLFIPSFTPTSTNTATPTVTPSPVPTDTMTPTLTSTNTPEPTLTFTATMTATETPTNIPTVDLTALARIIYDELSETVQALTPSPTPVIPDAELYSGLRKVNPEDGKELYFVRTDYSDDYRGFWMDWNEITNADYLLCVQGGYCSAPKSDLLDDLPYFSDEVYQNFPVVNVTRGQAAAYCSWAGKTLPTIQDWNAAMDSFPVDDRNIDNKNNGPRRVSSENSDFIGNVWEWLDDEDAQGNGVIAGGGWKTALQDVREHRLGRMKPNQYSSDLGFRCILRVSGR